jgi:hypothetical protein
MDQTAPQMKWAEKKDWERVRPHIIRLYVDEGKTLKQVMDIMGSQHGLRAT